MLVISFTPADHHHGSYIACGWPSWQLHCLRMAIVCASCSGAHLDFILISMPPPDNHHSGVLEKGDANRQILGTEAKHRGRCWTSHPAGSPVADIQIKECCLPVCVALRNGQGDLFTEQYCGRGHNWATLCVHLLFVPLCHGS